MDKLNIFKQFAPKGEEELNPTKNAVIYTRVSDSKQEDNTSLDTQLKNCISYAESNGYNVVAKFGGKHESAKTDKRKEFGKLLSYVKRTKSINVIIVNTYDRFSRTGGDGISIAKELQKKYKVATLAASQGIDPRTSSGELQRDLMLLIGYWENLNRIERTVRAMRELVSKGYTPYSFPLGYENLNKGSKAVDQKIVLNEKGKLLRKAFMWKAEKQMRNCEIIQRLSVLGLKLNDKRISEILANPYYCGVIVTKLLPNQAIQGNHEQMISRETFLKVNNVVAETRNHPVSHKDKDENLPLKRFACCSSCDTPLTGYLVRKKNLWYYKCRTKGCNSNKSAKQLHNQFKTLLSTFKINESETELIKIGITEMYNAVFEEANENQRLSKSKITELKKKLETAEENLVTGVIERTMFDKYSKKFNTEIADLENQLTKYGNGSSNLEKCLKLVVDFCQKPLVWWENARVGEKMILQNLIFPNGIIYNREKDRVLTPRINGFFSPIPELVKVLRGKQNGESTTFSTFPVRVSPTESIPC
jgi:DNA invertase Pin-like site-specific DNA recombinase